MIEKPIQISPLEMPIDMAMRIYKSSVLAESGLPDTLNKEYIHLLGPEFLL